jgi:hypothetical protein
MAISSLLNISVPVLGGGLGQGLLMPKLQYRFRVTFSNFASTGEGGTDTFEMTKQIIDVTRPNLTFENMEVHVYNSKVNLAGKHTWAPVTINIRDDASTRVQRLVGSQLQKQFDFMQQASAVAGTDYKFLTAIEILDGGNGEGDTIANILERWELYGCYISEANYNQLAYETSAPVTVALTVQYDNAIQTIGGGVGSEVARTRGNFTTS